MSSLSYFRATIDVIDIISLDFFMGDAVTCFAYLHRSLYLSTPAQRQSCSLPWVSVKSPQTLHKIPTYVKTILSNKTVCETFSPKYHSPECYSRFHPGQ